MNKEINNNLNILNMQLIKISTSKNFNSILFQNIINSNKLTKSPVKLKHSILISSKDLSTIKKITKRLSLPMYINK